jgi:hypothetical protein
MAQHFKYNTGATINNTTQKGNMAIATSGTYDWGPTSVTGYYPETTPPAGGYTIYYMRSTGGPSIEVATNDAQAIFLLKSFGSTGSTISDVLSWASGQANYYVQTGATTSIVTSGLTLNLDAGNVSSYGGTGTAWTDLSGNGYTATMTTTNPTFVSNGLASYFNLANSGKNLYSADTSVKGFTFGSNTGIPQTNGFTIELLVYVSSINANGQQPVFLNTGNGNGYRFGIHLDGSLYYMIGDSGGTDNATSSPSIVTTGNWYHLIAVYDRQNILAGGVKIYMYKNGSSIGSAAIGARPSMSIAAPNISYTGCCSAFDGRLNIIRTYNRPLTSSEVTQNYTAIQSRFGI